MARKRTLSSTAHQEYAEACREFDRLMVAMETARARVETLTRRHGFTTRLRPDGRLAFPDGQPSLTYARLLKECHAQ